MANENRSILTAPGDWSTTDLSYVLDNEELGFYNSTDDGTFYLIGDGVSTLTELYSSTGIMGGVIDSTNFSAKITALIGSNTKGIVDQKAGYRGSLATNPTDDWASASAPYLPGAVERNNDLYYYLFNSTSSSTEPAQETEWEVCPDIQTASKWTKSVTTAGMGSLSDPKSSDFKNYYKIGEYAEGSNEFDLYRINVAGQTTSTSSTDFYKLVDASYIKAKFSTFDTDHYELEDYRGIAIMSGDDTDGYREANGTKQSHASQLKKGTIDERTTGTYASFDAANYTGVYTGEEGSTDGASGSASSNIKINYNSAGQTGQTYNTSGDGDGNEGSDPGENFPNNVANGCGCVHVMIARGEITSLSG